MTVYGLYIKYPKGIDMREVTELNGLFATKELAEKVLSLWGDNAEVKPITVIDNLDWLGIDK